MAIQAIIFDKDGTLISFDAFWVKVSEKAVSDILKVLDAEDIPISEFLFAIGVSDGVTDIDGILCKGTYKQMAEAFCEVLKKHGITVSLEKMSALVTEKYNDNADSGELVPTCQNIRGVLEALKNEGIKLMVVTTDNAEITRICLEKTGIYDLFEKIFTDDGKIPPKPDPACVFEMSKEYSIPLDDIVMVGDTMTDIKFARNAGIRVISVASSEVNRLRLEEHADVVVNDISKVFDIVMGDVL